MQLEIIATRVSPGLDPFQSLVTNFKIGHEALRGEKASPSHAGADNLSPDCATAARYSFLCLRLEGYTSDSEGFESVDSSQLGPGPRE